MSGLQGEDGTRPQRSALLTVQDLTVEFQLRQRSSHQPTRTLRAVDQVSFSMEPGETLGLVGESGSGKSTLGRAILQVPPPTSGSVIFDGEELTTLRNTRIREVRRRMQMVFQDPRGSLDPRMRISEIVGEPLLIHRLARRKERIERVKELLNTVGLSPSFASRYPHEFSGGQAQRIGIARALALKPDFIVADEPVSALDVSIQAQIVNLLVELREQFGLALLFIAHDLAVVHHLADRVAVMYLGQIVEVAAKADLYRRPLHPYTRALLSAVPIPDPEIERQRERIVLTGDVPRPDQPPSGCRFRTRCPLRERLGDPEICSSVNPNLAEQSPGHWAACHFADEDDSSIPVIVGVEP